MARRVRDGKGLPRCASAVLSDAFMRSFSYASLRCARNAGERVCYLLSKDMAMCAHGPGRSDHAGDPNGTTWRVPIRPHPCTQVFPLTNLKANHPTTRPTRDASQAVVLRAASDRAEGAGNATELQ